MKVRIRRAQYQSLRVDNADYVEKPKLQPLVAEISWSKNLVIMARCKDDLELWDSTEAGDE